MTQETKKFDAEIEKILHLMIHSLYTNKEIFIRELISNASDACDKLRYLSQTDKMLQEEGADFKIKIKVDRDKRTITIRDNGIGMNVDAMSHEGIGLKNIDARVNFLKGNYKIESLPHVATTYIFGFNMNELYGNKKM